ncbi:hypothetical protein HK101_004401 [Irineochytrium annulatum]|nr:hypothetical protein HK101_004401 [Irineochytrium annulatum]
MKPRNKDKSLGPVQLSRIEQQEQWLFEDWRMGHTPSVLKLKMTMGQEARKRLSGCSTISKIVHMLSLKSEVENLAKCYLHRFYMQKGLTDEFHPFIVAMAAVLLGCKNGADSFRNMTAIIYGARKVNFQKDAKPQEAMYIKMMKEHMDNRKDYNVADDKEYHSYLRKLEDMEFQMAVALSFDFSVNLPHPIVYDCVDRFFRTSCSRFSRINDVTASPSLKRQLDIIKLKLFATSKAACDLAMSTTLPLRYEVHALSYIILFNTVRWVKTFFVEASSEEYKIDAIMLEFLKTPLMTGDGKSFLEQNSFWPEVPLGAEADFIDAGREILLVEKPEAVERFYDKIWKPKDENARVVPQEAKASDIRANMAALTRVVLPTPSPPKSTFAPYRRMTHPLPPPPPVALRVNK